jgi:hypothetical protein
VQPLLDQELKALPDKYRLVLVLCDLEGQTAAQVARQQRIPVGTVFSRLARGRALLRRRLAQRRLTMTALLNLAHDGTVLQRVADLLADGADPGREGWLVLPLPEGRAVDTYLLQYGSRASSSSVIRIVPKLSGFGRVRADTGNLLAEVLAFQQPDCLRRRTSRSISSGGTKNWYSLRIKCAT